MKNKPLAVVVLFMLIAGSAFSQEIRTASLEATALKGETGQFISGLGKDDFLLYERDRRMNITECREIESPLSLVLLIDVSGSMREIMKPTIEVALEITKSLRPQDEAAIVAFAKGAEVVQGLTVDKQIIEDRIKKMDETVELGRLATRLDEGILEAVTQLGKATVSNSRRVIIAITDNIGSSYPDRRKKEALRELSRSVAIVYALIAPHDADKKLYSPPLKEVAERLHNDPSARPVVPDNEHVPDGDLETYTKESGGFFLELRGEGIEAKVAALIDTARKHYLIEYKTTSQVMTPRDMKLKMSKEAQKREGITKLIVKPKAQDQ
jgi:VWFA-related protein